MLAASFTRASNFLFIAFLKFLCKVTPLPALQHYHPGTESFAED